MDGATEQQILRYIKEVDDWIHDVLLIPEAEVEEITEAEKNLMLDHLREILSEEVVSQYFDRLYYGQWENGMYTLRATGMTRFSWTFDHFEVDISKVSTEKYDVAITAVLDYPGMTSTLDSTISMKEGRPIIEEFKVLHD